MKQSIVRYLILQKRLLYRKSYLVMVFSVFLFVLVLRGVKLQDSSVLTVSIALEENADETARELYDNLVSADMVLMYEKYDTPKEAINAVISGKADEAWIIPADLAGLISGFAKDKKVTSPIQVYGREHSVIQYILREILEAQLYRYIGEELFVNYSNENLGFVSEDFKSYIPKDEVFKMYEIGASEEMNQPGYVIAPLRGMIALWMIISALASAMYYIYDEKNGLFVFWKTKSSFLREFFYIFFIVFDSSVIALIGILLGGVFTKPVWEIAMMLVYDIILVFFAMFIRRILRKEMIIGIFTPVIISLCAIFSPVFIDAKPYEALCRCIPPYHYLKSMFDSYYFLGMIIYCASLFAVVFIIDLIGSLKIPTVKKCKEN